MSYPKKVIQSVKLFCVAAIFGNALAVCGQASVPPTVLRGHRLGVTSVRFSNDGRWLASSSLDGTVRLWSTGSWRPIRTLNHRAEVYAIAFSPDGRLLVSGGYDGRLKFWQIGKGKLSRVVKFRDWIVGIAFTPTGQLVTGCSDGIVRVLNPDTGVIERTINTKNEMLSLEVSTDGRYLATSLPINLWDLASGRLLSKDIRGLGQNGLAFTPSGELLASAEGTGGARIFSVPSGELREVLRIEVQKQVLGPSGYAPVKVNMPASGVAFSRDGSWLATGGTDFGVQLWPVPSDKVSTRPSRVLTGHMMTVAGVRFSPNGDYLASASLDQTIRVWKWRQISLVK